MRPLRALSIVILAAVASLASDVLGGAGRNGGIVVLPSAVPFPESGIVLRGSFLFAVGEPISARLPSNLHDAAFAASVGPGMPVSLGRIQGEDFVVTAEELQQFRDAGASSFDVRIVGADGMALHLRVLFQADGSVTLQAW